jgi:hypothetical protein
MNQILAQAAPAPAAVNSAQGLLNLAWVVVAVMAVFAAIKACVILWHALTRDRASGEWKSGIVSAAGYFCVPLIVGILMVKLWGIAPPALNWN